MFLKHSLGALFVLIALFTPAWSLETSAQPSDQSSLKDFYAAVGSSMELSCECEVFEEKGIEWRRNGSVFSSGPLLQLHNISLEDGGTYTCHGPNGKTRVTMHLQIGYRPFPPKVECWAPSYPKRALCSWAQTQDPVLPTQYIATYWFLGDESDSAVRSCQRPREEDKQCVIDLEGLELYSTMPYLFNLTAINALGRATCIQLVYAEDIVKPDPPVNVTATVLPGKKVRVQWDPPPTWPDPVNFSLKYKVHFDWGKPNLANTMGPYEKTSMVRSGLVAGRTYHIRVSAMDFLGHGQSSEWSDPVNITVPHTTKLGVV